MTRVPTIERHQAIATPIAWFSICPPLPSSSPVALPAPKIGLIALLAKTPVSNAPSVPPAPWTPNASSESSYPNTDLTFTTIRKQKTPAMRPIHKAEMGVTKPEAGVIATSPATAPEIAPRAVQRRWRTHSAALQPTAAAAAPKCVATNAEVANVPALKAEPALNPNHPTHNRQAPTKLSTTECGGMGSLG